jgi:broad specificity phosphatase PhoE
VVSETEAEHPELWLARHGETDWSATGRHTGLTDIPLNDNGRAAARALAGVLSGQTFDLVLTSPLERAHDTAVLAGFSEQVVIEPNLREWDYGDYEGITTPAIRQSRPGWTIFADGCPGGETVDEVGARVDLVIARVRQTSGRVLAFAHGHSLRILAARWLELPAADGAHFTLGTATVSVLGWERDVPTIDRWNAR